MKLFETLLIGLCLMLWTLRTEAQQEVSSDLPEDFVTLDVILSEGQAPGLLVNGKSMEVQEVRMLLSALGDNEGYQVLLRAPDSTPFSVVVQVMEELRRHHVEKVDFAVLQPAPQPVAAVEPEEKVVVASDPPADEEKISRLVRQIMQTKDDSERDLGVIELQGMSEKEETLGDALEVLIRVKETPFDRAPFLEHCRTALKAESPRLRGAAIAAAPTVGATLDDVPAIVGKIETAPAEVRKVMAAGLFGVDPSGSHELTQPAIERLLQDEDQEVVQQTVRSLWGMPLSAEGEKLLIELSKTGNGEISYDAVYYGLSTRPLVTDQVAERLIELQDAADGNVSRRVIWALSHHPATDESRPKVVAALIGTIDSTLNDYDRLGCIHGLGLHGGATAEEKLNAIIVNDLEGQKTRDKAQRALKGLNPKAKSEPSPNTTGQEDSETSQTESLDTQ